MEDEVKTFVDATVLDQAMNGLNEQGGGYEAVIPELKRAGKDHCACDACEGGCGTAV